MLVWDLGKKRCEGTEVCVSGADGRVAGFWKGVKVGEPRVPVTQYIQDRPRPPSFQIEQTDGENGPSGRAELTL